MNEDEIRREAVETLGRIDAILDPIYNRPEPPLTGGNFMSGVNVHTGGEVASLLLGKAVCLALLQWNRPPLDAPRIAPERPYL